MSGGSIGPCQVPRAGLLCLDEASWAHSCEIVRGLPTDPHSPRHLT